MGFYKLFQLSVKANINLSAFTPHNPQGASFN